MRAIAGSILVFSATILLAAVRVASRLSRPTSADDSDVNVVLILAALVVGFMGVALTLREFRRPETSLPGDSPSRARVVGDRE